MSAPRADGILFDKDGTLFGFHATWAAWARKVISELSGGDPALERALAAATRFDLEAGAFHPDSPVIAGTNRQAAELVAAVLPDAEVAAIETYLMYSAAEAPLAPAVPLAPLLDGLAARGLALGVMTNDTEFGARAHLRAAAVEDRFAFIAGFDSGHGAKPAPDPLLAFAHAAGLAPARVVMVGDSTHDLVAGRAAGMQCVAVLTGMAEAAELAPHADAVLPDIGHLPRWLDGTG
ncbi:MAG: HAD family hydrolase [Paracoccaceae bacterium]